MSLNQNQIFFVVLFVFTRTSYHIYSKSGCHLCLRKLCFQDILHI